MADKHILDVQDLVVNFTTDQGTVYAERGITYEINEGEIVGIVGESGSGKSVSMYSIMGLLADNSQFVNGKVMLDGEDITETSFPSKEAYEKRMAEIRGNKISMIFQDPMTFLNPTMTIGKQIT